MSACRSCAGSMTAATWPRHSATWQGGSHAGKRPTPSCVIGRPNGAPFGQEENIAETFTFYRLPQQHHKHLKSTNVLERFNEEIKRRTHIVRIFPNEASCLRLVRALAVEIHEHWMETSRYLNMDLLREHKKEQLRELARAA